MPFFDFHVHVTLKSFFSVPPLKVSPWTDVPESHIPGRMCKDIAVYLLRSQGNLRQINLQSGNIVGFVFFFPDTAQVANPSVKMLARKMPVEFDAQLYKDIVEYKLQPFEKVLEECRTTLMTPETFGMPSKQVVPLFRPEDYDPNDPNKVYVFFTIEGAHTLSSHQRVEDFDPAEMITNLNLLRRQFPVVALNLVHIENSTISNQAYGMQFESDKRFRPFKNGIQPGGWQLLQHCYQHNILVDIKHLSLGAKKQLYTVRNDVNSPVHAVRQPIICTHAGFAGISWSRIPEFIYKASRPEGDSQYISLVKPFYDSGDLVPAFNATSINLYNEDILEIVRSKGLIGLSMDKRILGYQPPEFPGTIEMPDEEYPFDEEYIAVAEQGHFYVPADSRRISKAITDGQCMTWSRVEEGSRTAAIQQYHFRHFLLHVAHYIKVVSEEGDLDMQDALTRLCIGSDFDGIVHPIWCCLDFTELGKIQGWFERQFVDFCREIDVTLPAGFDMRRFSQQLFFENGKNFLFTRLALIRRD